MTTKQYDNYADLITFTRASTGTALRRVGYGSELAPSLDTWTKVGDGATTLTYNSGDGSLDVNAATVLDGAQVNAGLVTGKVYLFEADITLDTATIARITVNAAKTLQVTTATSATISLVFLADDPTVRIDSSSGTGTFTINSASVKEVIFDRATDPLVLFSHPTNTPRIEYDANGNRKGLLIEGARTNLLPYSEDFTNAEWVKTNTASLAIDASGPDGETSAVTLVDSGEGGNTQVLLTENFSVLTSTTYTFSVFAKADQLSWVQLVAQGFTTPINDSGWFFDLANGSIGSATGDTLGKSITDYGNGWYRCSITFTTDVADTTGQVRIYVAEGNLDRTVDLDGTSSILIYGAQLEASSFPTSYIPTAGSAATRAADVASIPTSAFGYNAKIGAGGTVIADFQSDNWRNAPSTDFLRVWEFTGVNNGLFRDAPTGDGNRFRYRLNDASGNAVLGALTISPVTANSDDGAKIAIAYARDDFAVCANGTVETTDTLGLFANQLVQSIFLGSQPSASSFANGYLKSIQYYPRRLSNAQLQELTS